MIKINRQWIWLIGLIALKPLVGYPEACVKNTAFDTITLCDPPNSPSASHQRMVPLTGSSTVCTYAVAPPCPTDLTQVKASDATQKCVREAKNGSNIPTNQPCIDNPGPYIQIKNTW